MLAAALTGLPFRTPQPTARRAFDAAYNGNRGPVEVSIHTPFMQDRQLSGDTAKFLRYALAQPDVWAVTISQARALCGLPPGSEIPLAVPVGTGGMRAQPAHFSAHAPLPLDRRVMMIIPWPSPLRPHPADARLAGGPRARLGDAPVHGQVHLRQVIVRISS